MGRLINSLFFALMVLAMVACGKKSEIILTPSNVEFAPEGGEVKVEIATNGDWTLKSYPEWVSVSNAQGTGNTSVDLTAPINLGAETREGIVEFVNSSHSAQVLLKQDNVTAPYLEVAPNSMNVSFAGGEYELYVTSNCEWRVGETPSWIAVIPSIGTGCQKLQVKVTENIGVNVAERTAVVHFRAGALMRSFEIIQDNGSGSAVVVSESTLRFDSDGGERQLTITCNESWQCESTASWLDLAGSSDSNNHSVVVQPNPNFSPRYGSLVFRSESGVITVVSVTQDAAVDPHFLNVTPLSAEVTKLGGTVSVAVGCDVRWKVDCQEPWLSFSDEEGEGDGSFDVIVEENVWIGERNASILVVSGALSKIIRLHQESGDMVPALTLSENSIPMGCDGGTCSVQVFSNLNWTASGPNWALPSVYNGSGNQTVSINVSPNASTDARTGVIRFAAGDLKVNLAILQEGVVYTLDTDVKEIKALGSGGDFKINVYANQSWMISKGASWIHYEPENGSGDEAFAISVAPNAFPVVRECELHVIGEHNGLVIIKIIQEGGK